MQACASVEFNIWEMWLLLMNGRKHKALKKKDLYW